MIVEIQEAQLGSGHKRKIWIDVDGNRASMQFRVDGWEGANAAVTLSWADMVALGKLAEARIATNRGLLGWSGGDPNPNRC